MAYAVIDPESRIVTCARAGHNPPAILRDGAAPEFVSSPGTALGAASSEQFDELIESQEVELRRGDALVFYTDGVTESMNATREQFGEDRLLETLDRLRDGRSARALVDGLLGEIDAHARDTDRHDDITIVVIRAAS
jgi:sigma-B regulation protein RsbU (phosphoserine phosphatase)